MAFDRLLKRVQSSQLFPLSSTTFFERLQARNLVCDSAVFGSVALTQIDLHQANSDIGIFDVIHCVDIQDCESIQVDNAYCQQIQVNTIQSATAYTGQLLPSGSASIGDAMTPFDSIVVNNCNFSSVQATSIGSVSSPVNDGVFTNLSSVQVSTTSLSATSVCSSSNPASAVYSLTCYGTNMLPYNTTVTSRIGSSSSKFTEGYITTLNTNLVNPSNSTSNIGSSTNTFANGYIDHVNCLDLTTTYAVTASLAGTFPASPVVGSWNLLLTINFDPGVWVISASVCSGNTARSAVAITNDTAVSGNSYTTNPGTANVYAMAHTLFSGTLYLNASTSCVVGRFTASQSAAARRVKIFGDYQTSAASYKVSYYQLSS